MQSGALQITAVGRATLCMPAQRGISVHCVGGGDASSMETVQAQSQPLYCARSQYV